MFEAVVVKSQATELLAMDGGSKGRSGLHTIEFVCSPYRRTKRRSGTIA